MLAIDFSACFTIENKLKFLINFDFFHRQSLVDYFLTYAFAYM